MCRSARAVCRRALNISVRSRVRARDPERANAITLAGDGSIDRADSRSRSGRGAVLRRGQGRPSTSRRLGEHRKQAATNSTDHRLDRTSEVHTQRSTQYCPVWERVISYLRHRELHARGPLNEGGSCSSRLGSLVGHRVDVRVEGEASPIRHRTVRSLTLIVCTTRSWLGY